MSSSLIEYGNHVYRVYEVNGTNEAAHVNYFTRTTLMSACGPLEFYAVFSDVDPDPLATARFFLEQANAKQLFNAVQGNIEQYRNPLINGGTLGETQQWLDGLTPWQYRGIVNPSAYGADIVYREYAGVQVVGERDSFELLELGKGDEELPLYKENHDDYFCIRVDLTEHQDESVLAFLYVKERDSLIPVMDELLDTFVDVEVVVSSVERLKALMGIPHEEV